MTKVVQLADDAYQLLAMRKRPGESFSEVVRRLAPQGSLLDLANAGTRTSSERAARRRDEVRALSRKVDEARLRKRGLI